MTKLGGKPHNKSFKHAGQKTALLGRRKRRGAV